MLKPIRTSLIAHRFVEAASLGAFATLWTLIVLRTGSPGWLALVVVPAGWLVADLTGGVVHFVADNFGSPTTPYFGPAFIKPFRDHHSDPEGITRHGFLERHGNNAMVTVPILALTYYLPYAAWLDLFALTMCLAVALTNQVHCWAHMPRAPRWARWIQATRLILTRPHHEDHHTPPYKANYCILSGWMEPVLHGLVRVLFRRPDELLVVAPRGTANAKSSG